MNNKTLKALEKFEAMINKASKECGIETGKAFKPEVAFEVEAKAACSAMWRSASRKLIQNACDRIAETETEDVIFPLETAVLGILANREISIVDSLNSDHVEDALTDAMLSPNSTPRDFYIELHYALADTE